ncbi:MAG: flagellar protein, partial [Candidatus Tectomicrobia bacterium]|nr:flagellar protein [Candidatus Tectomicrobia bacterium]
TQAASANVNSTDRTKINSEANALVNEIDRIANSTKYAGTTLLDGSYGVTISGQTTITATTGGLASATGMAADTDYQLVVTDGQGSNLKVTLTLSGSTANAQTVDNVAAPTGSNTTSVKFAAFGITLVFNSNMAAGSTTWSFYATDAGNSDFQVGNDNNSNNRVTISVGNATATSTGGLGLSTDMLTSASAAQTALDTIDTAISTLSTRRGDIGAAVNRLSYANANLASNVENTQAAESVIRDADMASEMTSFTKNQILLQAGTAMLAQANLAPQQVLSLFR